MEVVVDDLLAISDDGIILFEPKWILDLRWVKVGRLTVQEGLVHWNGLSLEDATWERLADLQCQFPNLMLEDKLCLQGEGNVMSQAMQVVQAVEDVGQHELASDNTSCG